QTAADAIVIANHEGNILYWNQSAEKMFDYKEEEILGQSLTILMPKEYLTEYLEEIQRLDQVHFPDKISLPREMVALRRDGEEFPIEISIAAWGSGGHRNYSAIIRDVTEKEQSRKHIEQRDRLAAVGQLAAGVAHDFNNLLGTVILFSELLLDDAQDGTETHEMLTAIYEQANRGAQLTSQILDFSRKSVIEKRPIDIVSFLSETRDLLTRTLPENIILNLSSSNKRFVIDADPTRLQQIIMNLAINARDAMSDGGELRFNLQQLENDKSYLPNLELSEGNWLWLQISDTGCGIPPDVMPHIFEPFFTTKPAGQGTGLGLAQVYGIVKQHGGHIHIASEEGKGTTFNLYFPLISSEGWVEDEGEIRHRIDGEGGSIMIVDDDTSMRKALEKILQSMNYKVVVAENGAQALEILKEAHGSIKLVLTDMVMPTMGGKELSQEMKKQFPDIKIVLMTGYPLGKGTRQLFDHSQMSWMQKPLTSAAVSKTLHEMLD
ncbi:MAG: PAS domain S-box protein, partial [Anaerolineales bacterium]|nr:PAS domain S-box protein [Anaerolineales bacterium]